jgi:hypothetical protein
VTRWAFATLATLFLIGLVALTVARLLGRSGSRASLGMSVAAQWLGAYVLWNFAGGLALHYGALAVYDGTLFGLLALAMGLWQYRTRLRVGREPALVVFVGGQLAWLVIIGVQNGLLNPS